MDEGLGGSAGWALHAAWHGGVPPVVPQYASFDSRRIYIGSSRGRSLTREVTAILVANSKRWLNLADILALVDASRPEVSSILHKLAQNKGLVAVGRGHNGWRSVKIYRWAAAGEPSGNC